MKNTILSFIAALTFTGGTLQAQWQLQHSSPSSGIEALQAFGSDTLYATTQWNEGILLRSYDGGNTVDSVSFPNVSLLKQHFTNRQTGFVAGYTPFSTGNSLFKTTDAGDSWQQMNLSIDGGTQHFNIHFTNSTKGFVSIEHLLYQTSDGGNSFSSRELIAEPHYISNIHFIDENTGFVSLVRTQTNGEIYRDIIFRTDNGGNSWQMVYSEPTPGQLVFVYPGISAMQFVNSQIGFAVSSGIPSTLLKTTDGGENWLEMTASFINDHESLTDVHFLTEQTGYAAVSQHIFKTINGGQNWQQQNINPTGDYYIGSIAMVNEDLGYASGNGIFKTTNGGGTVSLKSSKISNLGIHVYPNPCKDALNIQKPEALIITQTFITDLSGRILHNRKENFDQINTSSYAKGNYWLHINTQKGDVSIPFIVN